MGLRFLARRIAVVLLLLVPVQLGVVSVVWAQSDDLELLNSQLIQLRRQGKNKEATLIAERMLMLAEQRYDPDHPNIAVTLNNLAVLHTNQGRYDAALKLYKRSLEIFTKAKNTDSISRIRKNLSELNERIGNHEEVESSATNEATIVQSAELEALSERALKLYNQKKYAEAIPVIESFITLFRQRHGEENSEFATAIIWLGHIYKIQGRNKEAVLRFKKGLKIFEKVVGPDHLSVATTLSHIAELYQEQERYEEAEPLFKRCLAIREKALGSNHADVAETLGLLAQLYDSQQRYSEAIPLIKRTLFIDEREHGTDHSKVGMTVGFLAHLLVSMGRYKEAEPLRRRELNIMEKAFGLDHPHVGTALNYLALLHLKLERFKVAEKLFKRSLEIRKKAYGADDDRVASILNNLADAYSKQKKYEKAETLFKRALVIREKALGPDHPRMGGLLHNLGIIYVFQGRYQEALPLYSRSLKIVSKAFGPDHPNLARITGSLAGLYLLMGQPKVAEIIGRRQISILEKVYGPEHPEVAIAISNRATSYYVQQDWSRATDFMRRSVGVTEGRMRRSNMIFEQSQTGKSTSEAIQEEETYWGLIKSAYRLAKTKNDAHDDLASEMFSTAQWIQGSQAAVALSKMAARGATGDMALEKLVLKRETLVGEWQQRDSKRTTSVSQSPDKRDGKAEAVNIARLEAIDKTLGEIDRELKNKFPNYAALANPEPLSVVDVQEQLHENEALMQFLDTPFIPPVPEETFVWVVTKTDVRWVRSSLGTDALTREVAALRCGLDQSSWGGDGAKCAKLLGIDLADAPLEGDPLPFDLGRAHALYEKLFGEVKDLLNGKDLLIVPSGALTKLPFQVLVTQKPNPALSGNAAFKAASWLTKHHAITMLPAVSSLKALRKDAKASKASQAFIGFGNPLLDGEENETEAAKTARSIKGCATAKSFKTVQLRGVRRGIKPLGRGSQLASLDALKAQSPLPETADELCRVARSANADLKKDIYLGGRATEASLKALNKDGALARYKVIHFATHGTLAGELDGTNEPGLILSPPDKSSPNDDGYLSASEIATLNLDADWVILSACNTAGGGAGNAEALSGMARAFFYAGTRALLVSHWYVSSGSAVALITKTFDEIRKEPGLGRAQALRRAMLELINSGTYQVHPAYWAPFVIVGEGGSVSQQRNSGASTSTTAEAPSSGSMNFVDPAKMEHLFEGWQTEVKEAPQE